ncbi:hypothetical protein NCLIV_054160 [Neospora caninum Liverpool]|uniref:Transmembrane protein n=1 Tax=Neospora caninum (strain Liverpool) TaxID=572307 RepID=F0VMP3_NEOCL|nr:hypothetical protein NCLIV_054160 [Neospora caninum Liverpool]CBZ54989.1 hypothetical protein NCLIV_054160 [Neospora caninum Liverpool]CEL69712.1 TPA: hypothetical protein BN1204_054160 [Neospora caninum Liverpool]|eukprot:XP_003885017.1 hypothetical protein NCLIV_054160 [Neospora caninum Liverpool]
MLLNRYLVCCVLVTLFHCIVTSVAGADATLNRPLFSKFAAPENSRDIRKFIVKAVQQRQIPPEHAGLLRCDQRVRNSPAGRQSASVDTPSAFRRDSGHRKVNSRHERRNMSLRRHGFSKRTTDNALSRQWGYEQAVSVAARRAPKTDLEIEGILKWTRPSDIRQARHATNRDASFLGRYKSIPQIDKPSSLFESAAITKSNGGQKDSGGQVKDTESHHLPSSLGYDKKRAPRTQSRQSLASSFRGLTNGFSFTFVLGICCMFLLLLAIICVFCQVRAVVRELWKLTDFLVSTNELPFVVV